MQDSQPKANRIKQPLSAGFAFIFVTVTLDMLTIGLLVPVLPSFINQMTGGDVAHAAKMIGVFGFCWAFMQFVSMPIMGGLSDQFGRKPILLISNFGQAFANVLTALATNFSILLIARSLSGAVSAVSSTANAYIADVEPPETRAQKFGLLGAAFGLGFILGPAVGGQLAKIDLRFPFWAAAALCTLNGLFGLFILPESLKKDERTPFNLSKANPIGSIGFLASNPKILTLAAIRGLCDFAQLVYPATFVLYGLVRYGWGPDMTGFTLGLVGISSMIVQVALVGPFIKRFGEVTGLITGLVLGTTGYFLYAWAPSGLWFWAAMPIAALSGISGPSVQALLTRQIGPHEQGRLQGAVGTIQSSAAMIGPIIFTAAFAWSIDKAHVAHFSGAAFAIAGACVALALLLALTHQNALRNDAKTETGAG